ncbi:MBL fold metallo-hydrolase [Pleomorphomonas diazotrophica]|uniref:MBL fold metallo-hydrolase n=1 Tax=Pleomorphomonas diazotrophica TaxID=1166257 RepID=A0A1I4SD78_9HYPH|nr:MBL fold metallo-hydrolase [Pleomorphomonas diazotrophica]PKR88858.1 MBL fold metallo-hydrolase [Pleomorphomonas diazotrophica]SFM62243.1 Glyoxylase, beta-lactamase superfamily II [Pleomorphomonas diazotrophica]
MSDDEIPEFMPTYGVAEKIAEGVRRLTARNGGPLTFRGTNCYLLGEHEVTVIDPGPDDESHVSDLLAAVGAPIRRIVVTHDHADHAGAARRLSELTGAEVIGAAPSPARPFYTPDRVLADGDTVATEPGGLRAIATPGHTANHLCYDLADSGLLFSGDHVMGWSTSVVVPPDGRMADYMASLDRLAAIGPRTYLPGHGDEVIDGLARVAELKRHREAREAAILRALDGGDRTVEDIVAAVYIGLDPSLAAAAALSVAAHADWLEERGLVRKVADRLSRL